MPTPAMIPVTAGKKTAKTLAKGSRSLTNQSMFCAACTTLVGWLQPVKKLTRLRTMVAMTTYWILRAASALLREIPARMMSTAVETVCWGMLGKSIVSDSVKPTM